MSKTANWKKQFDEKFSKLEWVIDYSKIPHDGKTVVVGEMPKAEEIKAFIESLLEKEREKVIKSVTDIELAPDEKTLKEIDKKKSSD